jgi:hypothetical protein
MIGDGEEDDLLTQTLMLCLYSFSGKGALISRTKWRAKGTCLSGTKFSSSLLEPISVVSFSITKFHHH